MSSRWLQLTLCLVFLSACSSRSILHEPPPGDRADALAFSRPMARASMEKMSVGAMPESLAPESVNADVQSELVTPGSDRQVHYEGLIYLRAPQPRQVLEQATEWTRGVGGYVESLTTQQLVLQIPVPHFRPLYDRILGLGDVITKSLSARDVTEAFQDVDLRLKQTKTTRNRLLALIENISDKREKLRLLREVERLTAEIESLEAQMARLKTQVEYSRLTLNVEGRGNFGASKTEELLGFEWINALRPDHQLGERGMGKFELAVPSGLVQLQESKLWHVASADGAAMWTEKRDNEPKGDTRFWLDAIKWRLIDRYAQVEEKTVGGFALLRYISREEPRFVYWIGVYAKDDKLFVAQAYFPSLEHEKRYESAANVSLQGGVK